MRCKVCKDLGYVTEAGPECAVAKVCSCRAHCDACGDTGFLVEVGDGAPRSKPCNCRHLRRNITLFNQACLPAKMHSRTIENYEELDKSQSVLRAHLTRSTSLFAGKPRLFAVGKSGNGKDPSRMRTLPALHARTRAFRAFRGLLPPAVRDPGRLCHWPLRRGTAEPAGGTDRSDH